MGEPNPAIGEVVTAVVNIAGFLDAPADADPDRSAIILEDGPVSTYGSLREDVARWSATLVAAGVGAGQRLALVDWGGVRSTAVTLAAAHLGAATVQMNPLLTAGELDELVIASGCTGVGVAGNGGGAPLGETLPPPAIVLAHATETASTERAPGGDREALVLFTSGTTGLPKPVPVTHAAIHARVSAYRAAFDHARAPSVTLMCVPSFHVGGMLGLLLNLYAGDTTVIQERFDAGRWLELVAKHGVASTFLVPTMLARILDHPDRPTTDLSSLRAVAYGAAAAPVELVEQAMEAWPWVLFSNVFGQTETLGAYSTLSPGDHADRRRLGSVGKPLPGVDVRIVDPDTGIDTSTGDVGEVWVRSAQNVSEGWLETGDLARRDVDGYLYPVGRRSDVINRGGEKFGPSEVAEAVRRHPAVADVTVAGVPDREMGERVGVAIVVRRGSAAPTREELREWCRSRLASFKLPEVVVGVESLPFNELGKLPRSAAVELIVSRS